MPELPEVETSLRGISPHILRKPLCKIQIRNGNLRWKVEQQKLKSLQGQTLNDISRRGKYLIFHFQTAQIIIHLGMSGSLRIETGNYAAKKHDHLLFQFDDNLLVYHDPRRFGCVLYSEDAINHRLLKNLGPEPLSRQFNSPYLRQHCAHSKRHIKALIMDSQVVTGVGNIYACESLFLAGIHPQRLAESLQVNEVQQLNKTIKKVLQQAIKAGGTTLRDFVNSDGKPGYFQQKLYVYNRHGQNCLNCGHPIGKITQNQRSSFFCDHCQR